MAHFWLGLMRQLLHIAAFWLVLVVAIRLAVCFTHSLLARVLFSRHGPVRMRGEPQIGYLVRCARFHASWFAQAAFLFVAGWVALRWNASLSESLFFLVLLAVVIPALGCSALLAALFAFARSSWIRRSSRTRATSTSANAAQA